MEINTEVLIIGAGISGIAAATRLYENGHKNFVILEAENRIGGRINTVEFEGRTVDLGAQWCHGEKDNAVYQLVKDLDLLQTSFNDYEYLDYYDSKGNKIDKNLTDALLDIANEVASDEDCMKDCTGPYGGYFIAAYNEKVNEKFGTNKEHLAVAKSLLDQIQGFTLCLEAAPSWFDFSPAGSLHYQKCEGDLLLNWKDKGYKAIFDVLLKKHTAKPLPILEKVLFNKRVTKIKWDNQEKTEITCSDNSIYTANYVIVTSSLGVLKECYKTLFDPELPLYKQNAIEGLSMGIVDKILLKFPYKWWPQDCKGFNIAWRDEDRQKIREEFPRGPHDEDGRSWLEDIFGFYTIDSHPQVLLVWVVGGLVPEVEMLGDDVVQEACGFLLKKFLGNSFDIPNIENVLRSCWYQNPNFRGSYSYRGIETERRRATPKDLELPLVDGRNRETVLFAGEASHSGYYSTVHGALETGFREADRIIKLLRDDSKIYKVAIVGAGLAGLAAAKRFVQEDCKDIVILEALNKAGGRIHTVKYGDLYLELGAQWIHGKDNPVYKMAKQFDLLSDEVSDEGKGLYVRDDGVVFEEDLVKLVDFEVGKILNTCQEYLILKEYPKSVGHFLEEEFIKYLEIVGDDQEIKQKKMELLAWHVRFQEIDNSCINVKNLSAKQWGKYEIDYDTQAHINLKTGYYSIVDLLLKDIPEEVLRLETEVVEIHCDEIVKIDCRNTDILAEHVILTSSMGVLKQLSKNIHPGLPQEMQEAIDNVGFDSLGKIFLIYDCKWWKNIQGFQLIWRENAKVDVGEEWLKSLTGFDELSDGSAVLLGWIGGAGVRSMEMLSEEQVGIQCTFLLKRFLKKIVLDVPLPVKVIKSSWTTCPSTRGGYAYANTKCDTNNVDLDSLSKPVLIKEVPRILLAGEAVSSTHFSTTHGAYESGERQAEVLVQYFKRNNSPR